MADIFISYSHEDKSLASQLAAAFERHGWKVWWDRQLRTGSHYDDEIEAALEAAGCVVVLWSGRSVGSRYVKDEATFALEAGKLVPVLIENIRLPLRFSLLRMLAGKTRLNFGTDLNSPQQLLHLAGLW